MSISISLLFLFFLFFVGFFIWGYLPWLYFILYHTLPGNLLLLSCILLISVEHKIKGLLVGVCFVGFPYWLKKLDLLNLGKETFTTQSLQTFLAQQNTTHPHIVFDPTILETQVTQTELDDYNQNGYWQWSPKTIQLYTDALHINPFVRSLDTEAVDYAKSIYNEPAILQVLNYQTQQKRNQKIKERMHQEQQQLLPSGFGLFASLF